MLHYFHSKQLKYFALKTPNEKKISCLVFKVICSAKGSPSPR